MKNSKLINDNLYICYKDRYEGLLGRSYTTDCLFFQFPDLCPVVNRRTRSKNTITRHKVGGHTQFHVTNSDPVKKEKSAAATKKKKKKHNKNDAVTTAPHPTKS